MPFRHLLRRRREPPPLELPGLDRLEELVQRIVELVPDPPVSRNPPPPGPIPAATAFPVQSAPDQSLQAAEDAPSLPRGIGCLLFVPDPAGYVLVDGGAAPPERGALLTLDGRAFRVLRLGPSPLPSDRRRCAFLESDH